MDYSLTILRRQAQEDPSKLPAYVRALERTLGVDLDEPPPRWDSPGPDVVEESDKVRVATWFSRAETVSNLEDFSDFYTWLTKHEFDYGTACHAMSAVAVAAMKLFDRGPSGGITGYQSGFVMWGFIRRFLYLPEDPLRLVNYKDLLYPQHEEKFEKVLAPDVWDAIQERAVKHLEGEFLSENVRAHMEGIAAGKVPFGFTVSGPGPEDE